MGAEEPVKKLKVDGVEIVYLDEGKGPCALLGHCSSASHKEWLPLIEELKGDWRVLAPDFIGYGQSDPWPIDKTFSIEADVKVLLALAKKTRAKIHLVAHSYGAALALEAECARSATMRECLDRATARVRAFAADWPLRPADLAGVGFSYS